MHTMGQSLERYVEIKIHHLIKECNFKEIRVVGAYDRNCIISKNEKNDKITNWQRPTVEIENNILYLKCFPGSDYVRHYSSLVASYLAMNDRAYEHVTYSLPNDSESWDAVESIGLGYVPLSDVLVIGYGLPIIAEVDKWEGNQCLYWARRKIGSKSVTFLIVQFSYWGDILRRIVNVLASKGFETIIFTAKVGGIDADLTPNVDVVSGNTSFLDGECIEWENIFDLEKCNIVTGNHVNSASVMLEVPEWLERMRNFSFVDSEIGQFAKGAKENNMRFGYLHYISNVLSKLYSEDLSNERTKHVLDKREKLKVKMKKIIYQTIEELR